jgi:hypothetical protein
MLVDHNPFPINTLELNNPKVIIRPDQAEKAKGKNVIIGEQRPEIKVQDKLLEDTPRLQRRLQRSGDKARRRRRAARRPV